MRKMIYTTCATCNVTFQTRESEIKRGWGKTCSKACSYKNLSVTLEKKWSGNTNYSRIHAWIKRKKGRPSLCEFCKRTDGKFEWSNISGKYKEDITDWQRLCLSCHRQYDQNGKKAYLTRLKNKERNLR